MCPESAMHIGGYFSASSMNFRGIDRERQLAAVEMSQAFGDAADTGALLIRFNPG